MTRILAAILFLVCGCVSEAPAGSQAGADGGFGGDADAPGADMSNDSGHNDGGTTGDAPFRVDFPQVVEVQNPVVPEVYIDGDGDEPLRVESGDFIVITSSDDEFTDEGEYIATSPGPRSIFVQYEDESVEVSFEAALRFTAIDVGYQFACALTERGRVWCWGANDQGQLGRGELGGDPIPRPVDHQHFDARVVDIACGSYHCNAIDADGGLFGWGASSDERVGFDNGGMPVLSPRKVVAAGQNNSAVTVGYNHGCALDRGGAIACWGMNDSAQALREVADTDTTYRVVASGPYKSVVAGTNHTCAISFGDRVECAGGPSLFAGSEIAEFPVVSLTSIELNDSPLSADEIAVGEDYACAITNGDLYCFGDAAAVGNSAAVDMTPPVIVGGTLGAKAEVDASNSLTAFNADGVWYTVGEQCDGDQATGLENSPRSPTQIAFGGTITALSRGRCHTCLVSDRSSIFCAGEEATVLGRDSESRHLRPLPVPFEWDPN